MSAAGGRATLALTLVLAALFCLTSLAEVDFHWHLLTGERILREGRVPRADDLSYTSAGRPWVDAQWLFEVLLALTRRAAGERGLDLLKMACVTGSFLLAAGAARRRSSPGVTAVVTLAAVVASQERFAARPEIASFLMLGGLLWLLEERRDRPARLALLPPLFALWANLHALYAAGLGALGLAAAGETLEARRRAGAASGLAPGRLWGVLAASTAATLLTPYGVRGWSLPLHLLFGRLLSGGVVARTIAEFQPPFGTNGATMAVRAFALLAAAVSAALVVAWRDGRPADQALLVVFLLLAVLARRDLPLFALVAVSHGSPLLSDATRRAVRAAARRSKTRERALAAAGRALVGAAALEAVVLMAEAVSGRFYVRDAIHRRFGRGPAPCAYPEGAARFIAGLPLRGEVLNDLASGGYLAWRWFPGRRVFIDGRLEVHDESLYATYVGLLSDARRFEEIAGRYRIDAVLWSHRASGQAAPLLRYLGSAHGWRPVYADAAGLVFGRDGAPGVPAGIDLDDPSVAERILGGIAAARAAEDDPLPGWMRRLLPRRDLPIPESDAALSLGVCGALDGAGRLYRAALAWAPRSAPLHYDLALVLQGQGREAEARSELARALHLDERLGAARQTLAHLKLQSGDPDGALAEWSRAERTGGLAPASLLERGDLLTRRGRLAEATADLLSAIRLEPGWEAPRVALARVREGLGDPTGAEGILREIVAGHPGSAEAHRALASLLARTGRTEEAVDEVRAAVRSGVDPALLRGDPALGRLLTRPDLRALGAAER